MADDPTINEEERLERERKRRAIEDVLNDVGFSEVLKALFHALFDDFLFGRGPEEGPDADDVPDTPEQIADITRGLAEVTPQYQEYQREHAGDEVIFSSPIEGQAEVTSNFGHRAPPKPGASSEHKGVDIGARGNTRSPNILAAADGIVLFAGRKSGYGNLVIIGHPGGVQTYYGHMTGDKMPRAGQQVLRGQVIGVMGSEGISTGNHLHFEVRRNGVPVQPEINGVPVRKGNDLEGDRVSGTPVAFNASADRDDEPTRSAIAPQRVAAPAPKPAAVRAAPTPTPKPEEHHGIPEEVVLLARQAGENIRKASDEAAKAGDQAVKFAQGALTRLGGMFRV